MKVLFVGDLHLGVKDDDKWMQNIQRDFFDQAIEYSVKNGISRWIQFGDVFDTRKAVTQECMNFAKTQVLRLEENGITMDVIIGNHDLHRKDKITPNSVSEILRGYDHINIYEKATTINIDGINIDLIPWMCSENTNEILEFIKNTNSEFCIGHWELSGFWFYKGLKSHGYSPDFLSNYKQVWSGHFHTISQNGNVKYIGTPFTITAGDENDPRGFWVFDSTTKDATLVENINMWHRKLHYPDDKIEPKELKGKAVRIFASTSDAELVKIESKLEEVVHTLRTIVDNSSFGDIQTEREDIDEEVSQVSILTLGNKFIESKSDITEEEKKGIKVMFEKLYLEARSVQ